MKCILLIVGVLAILALTHAEDEAAAASPSEQLDSEAAIPAEPEQGDENQHHPHHEHGHGHPGGKPPKRTPVFGIGINFDSGK